VNCVIATKTFVTYTTSCRRLQCIRFIFSAAHLSEICFAISGIQLAVHFCIFLLHCVRSSLHWIWASFWGC